MTGGRAFGTAALLAAAFFTGRAAAADWGEDAFRVGGFIALDYELNAYRDASLEHLLEINKVRLNFDLQMTDAFSILAEYNPVPEELVDRCDAFPLKDGRTLTVARLHPEPEGESEEEGILPFERIEARWKGIGGRSLHASVGQLRNPFGLWQDFTAHRNSTATKNNALVLGIALHNVDIGAQVDGTIGSGHRFVLGVRNGATVRTQRPRREDDDDAKDLVGKFVTRLGGASVGVNAYLVGAATRRWALGGDRLPAQSARRSLQRGGLRAGELRPLPMAGRAPRVRTPRLLAAGGGWRIPGRFCHRLRGPQVPGTPRRAHAHHRIWPARPRPDARGVASDAQPAGRGLLLMRADGASRAMEGDA